ncbi:MAG: hypothetical protein CVT85_04605 [Alphaproteobacteria bacterium HGW-Alphaproteobacteria-7]|jgi:hypothetical protein|nr:MAG: hypothetical protein CVT85_04605 [Alphaproteobacteria bacterium HGW-Alphaproteobacteria-7]
MADHPIILMPGLAPAAPLLRLLSQFERHQIEAFAEISIAMLDLIDGDPDDETCASEDDFTPITAGIDFGPGCPIADPGEHGEPREDDLSTPFDDGRA